MSLALKKDPLIQRILADTAFGPAGDLVPEVKLHLATTPREILREPIADLARRWPPPYWAFAWPGGQALARHILDTPELVRGRHVLDVGAGSGLAAIAAMQAGAASARANDIDPLAAAAARLNANGNDVRVGIVTDDLLDGPAEAGLIVIGDLVYEEALEERVGAFLTRARAGGVPVLFGDRASSRLPALPFRQIAEYATVVAPPLEDGYVETARVWWLDPA